MGTWNISIDGVGCHHNKRADIDADLATKEFIEKLKAQGHKLARARFTLTGQSDDLLPPDESARALASGATYSNAAPHMPAPATLKDETMADTIRRVFAPGQRSPIDFKINLDGKDIANAHFKRGNRGSP